MIKAPDLPYRIIGIDPGLNHTGWGVVEVTAQGFRYVASGVLNISKGETSERLGEIARRLQIVLETFSPCAASIEKVFVNVNPQSTLLLGQARGAAITALALAGVSVEEFSPTEIKQAVTGSGRADKEMIQFMIGRILGVSDFDRSDEADALACAVCCANSIRLRSIQKTAGALGAYATTRRSSGRKSSRRAWSALAEAKTKE